MICYRAPGVDNWTILELQGTLETKEDVSLEGKAIGDLHFDAKVGIKNGFIIYPFVRWISLALDRKSL